MFFVFLERIKVCVLFQYIVGSLAKGEQPDIEDTYSKKWLSRPHYSGLWQWKVWYSRLSKAQKSDFADCFRVQMLTVYIARIFTVEWVEHIAKNKNPEKAVKLSPKIQQFIGIRNSTGLGIAPFLIKTYLSYR